jgi:predicted transcriptional regulator
MSHRLQVLISTELHRALTKAASRLRLSRGEWVRRAIEASLVRGQDGPALVGELAGLDAPTADIDGMLAEIDRGRSA